MGTIRSFVKPNNNPVDKVRRRIMNEYPKKHLVISFLGVIPQEQGKGVGTALMEYLLDKADAAQYVVYVEAVDYQTVKFFERFGFVSQGPISLSKDKSVAITPMVRQPVMSVNNPEPFYIRPGRRDSDKST
jgi:GNAT superfamily N-acetyltransferase